MKSDSELSNIVIPTPKNTTRRHPRTEANVRFRRTAFTVLAAFGVLGGVSSLFIGIVFVILHSIIAGDRMFDQAGTGLLIVAIPMILTGSLFIDYIDPKNS